MSVRKHLYLRTLLRCLLIGVAEDFYEEDFLSVRLIGIVL